MIRRPGTDAVRGGLVGAATVVLAVAAHGWAGGGSPDSSALALLLLSAVATGAAAAWLPAIGGMRGRATVVAVLGAGQTAAHLALSLLPAHGGGDTACGEGLFAIGVPGGWMAVAHTVATVVCALLIVAAERLYAAVSRSVRAVTSRPRALPGITTARWRPSASRQWQRLSGRAAGSRAPPVLA
ncbi:hypothetical protein [Nocardia spumae]|uniref:hypothetical protein n=1 Tax=Nocardia spumae TaxID=2887190 RepID=UPI001D15DB4C|nr:hypothetical protein [Nocardia spumae]